MSRLVGIILLILTPFFYRNYVLSFFLLYFGLMLVPESEKFLRQKLHIDLKEYFLAVFLLVYGCFWILRKTFKRWGANLVILFFIFLQFFLKLFGQFRAR